MRDDAPCRNCNRKYTACHDHCEEYMHWKEKYLKLKAARKEYKLQRREDFLRSEQCYGNKKNWR